MIYAIADSSALISLSIYTDTNYQMVQSYADWIDQHHARILILPEVFSETCNIYGKKYGHRKALSTIYTLQKLSTFSFIESSAEIRKKAIIKYDSSSSSTSFTDCLVMACADEYQTKHIFGFDDIFTKSGYITPQKT